MRSNLYAHRVEVAAVFIATLFACQPTSVQWHELPPTATLGQAVYEVVRLNTGIPSAEAVCTAEKVALLEGARDDFVTTFDQTLEPSLVDGLPGSIETALLPLIDDQRLPALTDSVARVLALLVDPIVDPDREALTALLALGQSRSVLSGRHLLGLGDRLLADAKIRDVIHAVAELAVLSDNGTPFAESLLEVLANSLDRAAEPIACTGLSLDGSALLRADTLEASIDFGPPAWSVFADANGNPKVRIDPSTGTLYAPFRDDDQDGVADVNIDGEPIDRNGDPVSLPTFVGVDAGTDAGRRDTAGLAVDTNGAPIFDYFDAKRTSLSVLIQFLGEAAGAGLHGDLVSVARVVLGEAQPCPNLVDGCLAYPAADHPIADIAFALIEDLRYERIATLLETWNAIIRDDPAHAEAVLVSVGQVLEALDVGGLALTDSDIIDLFIEAMPLIADVFERSNSTGDSTARLLIDVVHQLGDVARDLPNELLLSMEYVVLFKADACSAALPDLALSVPVSLSLPRYYNDPLFGLIDNRSGLEQSIELLAEADCGSVPFTGGKTVSEVIIGVMADSSANTACNIIDISLGVMDILPWVSEIIGALSLDLLGCDGSAVWADLTALDGLAKSGMLDALLPLANAFEDRGQLRTLIDIFHLIADDLHRDDDALPDHSTVRRALPTLARVLRSGAADSLFDLDDLLATVPAVDGSGNMADVIIDSLEFVTDDTGTVRTRRGDVTGTSVALEMLNPYREIIRRLASGSGAGLIRLDHTIDHVTGYLRRTQVDDRGTADPSDDVVILADRRLLPTYEALLAFSGDTFALPPADRQCYFDAVQNELEDLMVGPDFATGLRLLDLYARSTDGEVIDGALGDWLTPQPEQRRDTFGALMQVVSAVVQSRDDSDSGRALADFGARALREVDGPQLLTTVDRLLIADPNELLLSIGQNLIDIGEDGRGRAPLVFFSDLFIEIDSLDATNACMPGDPTWQLTDAEEAVRAIVDFLRADETGLPAIYELIRLRSNQ